MKFDGALQIPSGTTVPLLNSGGAVAWEVIPALKSTLVYSAATVDVVAATNTYHRNVGNWSGFAAGDLVEVAGYANPGNNLRHRVVSVTGPNMVVATTDPMVLEGVGPAVTFTRVDEMPRAVRMLCVSSTLGKISLGKVGDAYPANDSTFFFVGGGMSRIINVIGYEIFWYTNTAASLMTASPVANI